MDGTEKGDRRDNDDNDDNGYGNDFGLILEISIGNKTVENI